MRGVIHHLDLTVRDPGKVFAFYDAILSALGYRLERKSEQGFDWNLQSPLGVHSIGVVKASSEGAATTRSLFAGPPSRSVGRRQPRGGRPHV
jgi:hypothetical protein